jgi:uncharacterized membrane protein YecN with MAPEG domain
MNMNAIALTCTAALGLLLFALGFAVSGQRFRDRTLSGHASNPEALLCKLVRAHGNTAEYAAFLAVLFLFVGAHNPPQWAVWSMVGATISRFLVVLGLLLWPSMAKPNPARFVGGIGTYVFGAVLCLALFNTGA